MDGCRPGDFPPYEPPPGRGQALVEFALLAPLLFAIFLGGGEMGFLYSDQAHQARQTQVIADYAADRDGDSSWQSVANDLLPGCDVAVTVTQPQGIYHAEATCQYAPRITSNLWDGIPISTAADAVARTDDPTPTPTPTPTPSPTPCVPVCLP